MNDKALMENLLQITKGMCDLYSHGTIESSTKNVHSTFHDSLSETLNKQYEIYNIMEQRNWYQSTPVETQKIAQAISKFCCN